MSKLLLDAEIKNLMKLGLPYDLAVLSASSKLIDKSIFNSYLERLKDDNQIIEQQLSLLGFKKSVDNIGENEPKCINDKD